MQKNDLRSSSETYRLLFFFLINLFTLYLKGPVCLKPVVCAGRSTRSGLWCCLYCVTVRSVCSDRGSRMSCSSVQAEAPLNVCSSYGEDALNGIR